VCEAENKTPNFKTSALGGETNSLVAPALVSVEIEVFPVPFIMKPFLAF
jgi:hypothetical protein